MPFHTLNRIDQHSFHYLLLPDGKPARRHTALKGFDLSLGTPKLHWNLSNGKIYKLPAGASAAELFLEHRTLMGVDGIAFLDGVLYVNNVVFNNLYRIPVDPEGKPSQSVDIWTDQPVS